MDNQPQNQQFPNQNIEGATGGFNPPTPPSFQPPQPVQPTQPQPNPEQPTQPYNPIPQQKQPNKFLEFLKQHKLWFIIGGAVAVLAIVLVIVLIPKGGSSGNGYVAQSGQDLKVKEQSASFDVSILGPLEKFSSKKGDYVRLKVSVKNNSAETESFAFSFFELVDSAKNTVYKESPAVFAALDSLEDCIGDVGSGETKEGYLYFYSDKEEGEYESRYVTDYTKMNEAEYLKLHIMSNAVSTGGDNYNVYYEDYYLPIKK